MADLTQLGVGGTIAYLLIKEVLGFLSKKKNNNSGEKSPEYWLEANRKLFKEVLDDRMKMRDEELRRMFRDLLDDRERSRNRNRRD